MEGRAASYMDWAQRSPDLGQPATPGRPDVCGKHHGSAGLSHSTEDDMATVAWVRTKFANGLVILADWVRPRAGNAAIDFGVKQETPKE